MNLKKYREAAELTQEQLGIEAGLTQQAISLYERGISHPPIYAARMIIKSLRKRGVSCTLDELFGE